MSSISLNILFPEVNPDQQCLPTCFKKTKQMPKRHGFTCLGILAGFGLCSYVYIKALQASLLDASQRPTNSAQAKLPLLCLSRACLGCSNKPAFFHPPPTIPCRKFGIQVEVVCPVCLQVMDSGGHDSSAAGHCPNLLRVGLRISWGGAQVEVSICNVLVLHCYCDGTSGWYSTGSVMGVLD